jgi:hypothetical protein
MSHDTTLIRLDLSTSGIVLGTVVEYIGREKREIQRRNLQLTEVQGGSQLLEPWEESDPTVILPAEKLYRGCKPEAEQAAIPGPLAPTAVSSRAIDLAAKTPGLVVPLAGLQLSNLVLGFCSRAIMGADNRNGSHAVWRTYTGLFPEMGWFVGWY